MPRPKIALLSRPSPWPRAGRGPFSLRATAWASHALVAATLLQGGNAWAQLAAATADEPLMLRRTPLLRDVIPSEQRRNLPIFVTGERTTGLTDYRTTVEGNAEFRRADIVIRADKLDYTQPDDLAIAMGNVYINRAGDIFTGPHLELQIDAMQGFFERPSYRFLGTNAYGQGSRIDFIDDQHMVIHDVTYTTCQRRPGPSWMPDWVISARSLEIDQGTGQGVAHDGVMQFKGLRMPAVPSLSFPLTEARQSGFLPPVIGLNSISGVETMIPYYWNIAPNRDATLYPSLLSKRGVDLAGEFRYLESNYRGQIRGNYMPDDQLRNGIDRWGISALHTGTIDTGIDAVGAVGFSANINRASDNNYWRDFPRTSVSLTQRLLPTDLNFSWGRGDFTLNARSLKWQTLQDVNSVIVPPYDRLPQVVARYGKLDANGFDYSVEADYTQFESNPSLTNQPNARRQYLLGQISRPFLAPGGFFTPKVQLHSRHYDFEYALASTGQTQDNVTVPTFSIDSGLVYERNTSLLGRALIQTLEPRAFYVRTPFRNQNNLPNYDTARSDFNFASIYNENAFVGNDRISDNNLLTVGVTTRLIDANTGAEAAKFGIAQRLRFQDQKVVLPGEAPVTDRLSDVMVGGSVNWTEKWAFDSTVQYNPKTDRSVRSSIGGRYSPGDYRLINAAYRLQRGTSEQVDVGWQWPINDLWGDFGQELGRGRGQGPGRLYTVGRVNYSMFDSKITDAVVGFEYEGDCWIGRVVLERLQSSTTTANKRLLFQIEFFGMSRVGSSPLEILRRSIPRYQYLNEQVMTPSRFSNYD
ncbi:LPS-assembly protein LptD [Xylophilus sp. GOD-11R]|uniref:LPS-assembly protein LptD n=1 Tax=Xylophilus sp. GOD-11R TaxID=3089814 RepID=UPI00298C4321|nr:LPS assembly protein LptD [Xylophilus sp. GOD-11R]WPB57062.1 LPS assembly protein LptD [Xylophilus sp. GOD-11R]